MAIIEKNIQRAKKFYKDNQTAIDLATWVIPAGLFLRAGMLGYKLTKHSKHLRKAFREKYPKDFKIKIPRVPARITPANMTKAQQKIIESKSWEKKIKGLYFKDIKRYAKVVERPLWWVKKNKEMQFKQMDKFKSAVKEYKKSQGTLMETRLAKDFGIASLGAIGASYYKLNKLKSDMKKKKELQVGSVY